MKQPTPSAKIEGAPPKLALTPAVVQNVLKDLHTMTAQEKLALLEDLDRLDEARRVQRCKDDFLAFCHAVYPDFKEGPHHRHLRPKLEQVCHGEGARMTISLAPRFGKSLTISYLFVAWYLGHHPEHHIIMVTHTATLSADFGRKIRNLIDSPEYQAIFPGTQVSKDKSAADNWTTTAGGKYLAVGVGANLAGHGANLCLDPAAEVLTTEGPVALRDLQIGARLKTKFGWFRVTKKKLTTHDTAVTINQRLVASIEHPFYTQRGWVPAGELTPGDKIETRTVWSALWQLLTLRKNPR